VGGDISSALVRLKYAMEPSAQGASHLSRRASNALSSELEIQVDEKEQHPQTKQSNVSGLFRKHWRTCTDDNNLTLHGFRRYKTAHLLNLRFLEDEISELDHQVYQAGLSLEIDPSPGNRLGLKHCKRDSAIPCVDETITRNFILELRDLIKQYGVYYSSE
jgi:hypothetical protein